MLLMKAWMETRWRLASYFAMCLFCLAVNYQRHDSPTVTANGMMLLLGLVLATGSIALAGSGVKSQAPVGFPEGLAGSTQFTISLPVSRQRLLAVRAAVGMLELFAATILIGWLSWGLFPSLRASTTTADFAKLLLTGVVLLTGPYFACVFFATFVDEPLTILFGGWSITLVLWLFHHIAPAVDIVRAVGKASPLITHELPLSQLATSVGLATIIFLAAVRVVQTREY
jgi:hypothetical protein